MTQSGSASPRIGKTDGTAASAEPRLVAVIRRRVRVWGRVQGVGYRLSAVSAARSRGLSGWVRNGSDGSVEAVFEGEPDAVEAMERWCERGPRGARVERVESFEEQPEGLDGFDVRD
jgi:acylphosphatase